MNTVNDKNNKDMAVCVLYLSHIYQGSNKIFVRLIPQSGIRLCNI